MVTLYLVTCHVSITAQSSSLLLSSGQTRDTAPCGRAAPARPGSSGHCQPPARPRLLATIFLSLLTNQRTVLTNQRAVLSVLTNQRAGSHLEQTVGCVRSAQGRPRPHLTWPQWPQLPQASPCLSGFSLSLFTQAGSLLS